MSTVERPQSVVKCARCGHAVSAGATYCPQCGAAVRRRRGRAGGWFVLVIIGAVVFGRVSRRSPPAGPTDAMLAAAADVRNARAADLEARAAAVAAVQRPLADQVATLSNLSARIKAAAAQADDENRWPARVAGRSLQRGDVDRLVRRIDAVLSTERAAVDRDAAASTSLSDAARALRAQLADIAELRRRLSAGTSRADRASIDAAAAAYRDASDQLPSGDGLGADPAKPIDVDALLR